MKIFRSSAFKAFVCVIAALLVGTVIAAYSHSKATPLSAATSTVLQPLQKVSAYLSYKFANFNDYFKSSSTLAKENEELRNSVERYQKKQVDYDNMKRQVEFYEKFLDLKKENEDYKFEKAMIISRDAENYYSCFTLDKGNNRGISVNDPVIFGSYLIGVVTSVSPNSCTVETIASPDVNVGIYETYSGEVNYTTGTGSGRNSVYCKIENLKKDTEIFLNGIICTSGKGGIFPRDLIVGSVSEITDSKNGEPGCAMIKSAVDFDELTDVMVITSFDGQGIIEN